MFRIFFVPHNTLNTNFERLLNTLKHILVLKFVWTKQKLHARFRFKEKAQRQGDLKFNDNVAVKIQFNLESVCRAIVFRCFGSVVTTVN